MRRAEELLKTALPYGEAMKTTRFLWTLAWDRFCSHETSLTRKPWPLEYTKERSETWVRTKATADY